MRADFKKLVSFKYTRTLQIFQFDVEFSKLIPTHNGLSNQALPKQKVLKHLIQRKEFD